MDAETWGETARMPSDCESIAPAMAFGITSDLAIISDLELLVAAFDVGGAWAEAHDGGR